MKFGYCINMLALPGSDGSGREWIPMIARLGFDYAELPLAQMMVYDDAGFDWLFVQPLRESGLTCRCCNNFFPASIRLTGPDVDADLTLAYAKKAMARAKRLGAEKIVFGSAGARNYPAGFLREEAKRQLRETIFLLEPIAAEYDITLVMEHLNKLESNLLNSLEEGVELVNDVRLAHVRCLMDNYHMMLGGDGSVQAKAARGILRHVHLARVLGRSLPCEDDEVDWVELFSVLREIGYDEDCSIEAYAPMDNRGGLIGESLGFLHATALKAQRSWRTERPSYS